MRRPLVIISIAYVTGIIIGVYLKNSISFILAVNLMLTLILIINKIVRFIKTKNIYENIILLILITLIAAEMNTVQNLVEVATSDLNEQWAIFSQGALRVSARELEERVNTVKSDLDKMSAHIDLTTPKLRPWDDAQLGKLQNLLNEIE